MKNKTKLVFGLWILVFGSLCVFAQEPKPGAAKPIIVPAVKEKKLANGLTVATIERKNVPLVTIQLLIKSGANSEDSAKAGLADMTATLLTKGTKTRSAKQIAEQIEFLGGSINSGASWNNSEVSITVSSDKLDQAMAILADVVLNPVFKEEEIELLKGQMLDELNYNLQQPGFLSAFVASNYSFGEHPVGGTVETIEAITQKDIIEFHNEEFVSENAALILTGDVNELKANTIIQKYLKNWKTPLRTFSGSVSGVLTAKVSSSGYEKRINSAYKILVIDMPNSGQASVSYNREVRAVGRNNFVFYWSSVLNSILGGGYSSRLNQEIRIKRGLSYGAGSSFAWRSQEANFSARTQTKNESAAEVAELIVAEIKKLTQTDVSESEMNPRKLVLIGDFGRELETTAGLANSLAELFTFKIPTSELNSFMKNVQSVKSSDIQGFAKNNLQGGDIIIVGDYAKFKDDLAKRFPKMTIDVIKADELDLSKENLRK